MLHGLATQIKKKVFGPNPDDDSMSKYFSFTIPLFFDRFAFRGLRNEE